MSNSNDNTVFGAILAWSCIIGTIILAGLKLAGVIAWPWLWVFTPLILWAGIILAATVLVLALAFMAMRAVPALARPALN